MLRDAPFMLFRRAVQWDRQQEKCPRMQNTTAGIHKSANGRCPTPPGTSGNGHLRFSRSRSDRWQDRVRGQLAVGQAKVQNPAGFPRFTQLPADARRRKQRRRFVSEARTGSQAGIRQQTVQTRVPGAPGGGGEKRCWLCWLGGRAGKRKGTAN